MTTAPCFTLNPHVSAATTAHGAVLLDQRSGHYWQMNPTATLVLHALLDGATPEEAAARLTAAHPSATDRAGTDVAALIQHLRDARLIAEAPWEGQKGRKERTPRNERNGKAAPDGHSSPRSPRRRTRKPAPPKTRR
ncbi:lasso peptide biosynthesis PqqD family chaperone [Streptomyces sp. NPDC003077]|uniref:lasso peptide biosynthesis PqqD family chaperone n=1 Tax=Streptomyces sp. NPDC003077 TaxID=3154443 RepID=UPI0033BEAAAA